MLVILMSMILSYYDSDNDNSEDPPRDHDLPPTCSIAFLAGPAEDEILKWSFSER